MTRCLRAAGFFLARLTPPCDFEATVARLSARGGWPYMRRKARRMFRTDCAACLLLHNAAWDGRPRCGLPIGIFLRHFGQLRSNVTKYPLKCLQIAFG